MNAQATLRCLKKMCGQRRRVDCGMLDVVASFDLEHSSSSDKLQPKPKGNWRRRQGTTAGVRTLLP